MAQGKIRLATITDIDEIACLYRDTITTVNLKDYTIEQTVAWAGRGANIVSWAGKIADQYFIVMLDDGRITGFSSLTDNGHIDMLFVHRLNQQQGVGKALLEQIEDKARQKGLKILTTDSSLTAKPVFERYGFSVETPQHVLVDGVELINFRMSKSLE